MFSAYHFRLRYSLQREKLLKQEKEEAHLQSKLKEEESARLRLEKHEAELQSMLKAEEAARLEAEQRLLKAQQEQLHKELLAGTLQIEHKNELLQNLKEKLLEQPSDSLHIRRVERILNDELRVDEDFEKVKSEFKDVHPEFFSRVQQHAQSKLTSLDLKYCAYMYMQLSSKQIASLLHVEPKSVRMAKYRIKQKLGLAKEEVLEEWLRGNFTS
jgi:DNA-binding CsgD family transcriptional regulator